ncbi:DNA helicase II related protein [Pseudomonas chlororaphis]|uniref:UvrD-helicase domain-containing protein n=1 Tax=Pseudomonas chlororaphis TaxID=587753 RepID=UPI000F6F527E|nr:UvrD-helicase domain-containing protein [Pseudomonas chlororaphis]AZD09060.1 DNA helicase II related protein [Pseudomonas chlororaphis]
MNTNWWRNKQQMDKTQRAFIGLPVEGRYFLSGPPGSGKTNLLLLRAEVTIGGGDRDILFITYTRSLADFIRSGATSRGLIEEHQIKTFHSWAFEHVLNHLGERIILKEADFDEDARNQILQQILEANSRRQSERMYSAIFVDEAQDLRVEELKALLELSDNVCVCGDDRQGIYQRDGIQISEVSNLESYVLDKHFRMGQAIAKVADRLMPPAPGGVKLEDTCNYDQSIFGEPSADLNECASRDEQFNLMLEKIRIQLDAFRDEPLGIFCPRQEDRNELRERFDATDIGDLVSVHGVDETATFVSQKPIHILTLHGCKGTEFRCVHIYGAEGLRKFPLNRTTLSYTGITRAKTSLNVYRTGKTSTKLENAFAKKQMFSLDNLLPDEE